MLQIGQQQTSEEIVVTGSKPMRKTIAPKKEQVEQKVQLKYEIDESILASNSSGPQEDSSSSGAAVAPSGH